MSQVLQAQQAGGRIELADEVVGVWVFFAWHKPTGKRFTWTIAKNDWQECFNQVTAEVLAADPLASVDAWTFAHHWFAFRDEIAATGEDVTGLANPQFTPAEEADTTELLELPTWEEIEAEAAEVLADAVTK